MLVLYSGSGKWPLQTYRGVVRREGRALEGALVFFTLFEAIFGYFWGDHIAVPSYEYPV